MTDPGPTTTHGATIVRLSGAEAVAQRAELTALLCDAVESGASIGFLRPLDAGVAARYWSEVLDEVDAGTRVLLGARRGDVLVGSAQLGLCTRPNGRHRAEVQKVLVHSGMRHQGLGRALMVRLEEEARRERRTLLYLDTQPDQPAERMYAALGWTRAGAIPDYATTPDGVLHATVLYFRVLGGA